MARPEIDLKKCVHCQDCVAICPVGVYRFLDKRVLVVDARSCLGPSCQMCADSCWKMALTVTAEAANELGGTGSA